MRNPFKTPTNAPKRVIKRLEHLELAMTDVEDTIEKVLYQQTRLLGKVNARYKRELKDAEAMLDESQEVSPPQGQYNGLIASGHDLKAELRQRAAQLRRR